MRSPSWIPDELILALGLYMKHGSRILPSKNSNDVLRLSEQLNHTGKTIDDRREHLRCPAGVYIELMAIPTKKVVLNGKGCAAMARLTLGGRPSKAVCGRLFLQVHSHLFRGDYPAVESFGTASDSSISISYDLRS